MLAVIALAGLYQLMIPPLAGLADNGDFPRIMGRFSLSHVSDASEDRYFYFFNAKYEFDREHYWNSRFFSSTALLGAASVALNHLVSKDGLFDVRCLALLYLALVLIAAWLLLVWSRSLKPPGQYILGTLLGLALTDVGYLAYFNSFYSEPTAFVFLLLALAAVFLTIQRREGSVGTWLAIYVVAGALFVTAKPQYAIAGLPLAAFSARLIVLHPARWWRAGCLAGVAALLACSAASYRLAPPYITSATYYISIFSELLHHSPDPRTDLTVLGLSPDLAKFASTHPYQPESPFQDPEFQRAFFDRITVRHLLGFYLRHPERLYESLDRSAASALRLRPENLGNFEKSAGFIGGERTAAFSHWSALRQRYAPRKFWSLAMFFGLNLAVVGWLYANSDLRRRLVLEFYVLLILVAASQFGMIVILQGTIDPIKHMYLVCALFDICVVASAVWVAGVLIPRLSLRPRIPSGSIRRNR